MVRLVQRSHSSQSILFWFIVISHTLLLSQFLLNRSSEFTSSSILLLGVGSIRCYYCCWGWSLRHTSQTPSRYYYKYPTTTTATATITSVTGGVAAIQTHTTTTSPTGTSSKTTTTTTLAMMTQKNTPLATAPSSLSSLNDNNNHDTTNETTATTTTINDTVEEQQQCTTGSSTEPAIQETWDGTNDQHIALAKQELRLWPLDQYNIQLLNEVHPYNYNATTTQSTATTNTDDNNEQQEQSVVWYDLIAIGSGAGGLVSSKQSARRGAKSAMISAHLAGGDCLNVGCVPSKALLRAMKAIREVQRASEFGIRFTSSDNNDTSNAAQLVIDFPTIMNRMRQLRSVIAPADGHVGTTNTGATVYQGFGKFTSPNTIQVLPTGSSSSHNKNEPIELKFRTAVIASGGRPAIPTNVPGLQNAPYTTNEILFNLETLPPRMIVLGAGIIALEMAQCFATFGSHVTVLQRSATLFASTHGDTEAAQLLQTELEESGVTFIQGTTKSVTTLRDRDMNDTTQHPLMSLSIEDHLGQIMDLECECLLIAIGRVPNVEKIDLEKANVQYEIGKGIIVNDHAQSITNPNVYAVGDCVAGVPRLTHMSGEMAKLVVQNSLFNDDWKLSSLVVPAVMYSEPEYATVGMSSVEMAMKNGIAVDTYRTGLEHNDRAILESSNCGFVKIFCRHGTDEIVGATIVAERAGEMMNEITLAMKNNIGLRAIGRNIHPYPTTGEAVMGCGIQYINANWERLN